MTRNIIFVGGIHGVGKSKLCREFATEFGLTHIIASDLIKSLKTTQTSKRVKDVGENQSTLIEALEKRILHGKANLLDGHFCLLGENDEIQEIPKSTFQDISPIAALVLYEDITIIKSRLEGRDGNFYKTSLLTKLQEHEIQHAKLVCESLNIPLQITKPNGSRAEISSFIGSYATLGGQLK